MNPERSDRPETGAPHDESADVGQRLSCLLDGELDSSDCQSLLERLRHDEQAQSAWARFSCVGDALRSAEVAAFHAGGFAARVAAALEREPTILAPVAARARSPMRRWLLPGAGAAAAAAVLIAVALPVRQSLSPEPAALAGHAPPVVAVAARPLEIDRSPLLERYLAAHRELAEPSLMPQSTPYVRTSGALLLQEGR